MVWFPHIDLADGRPWDDRGTTEAQEFEMAEASLPGLGGRGVPGLCKSDRVAGLAALVKHMLACLLAGLLAR